MTEGTLSGETVFGITPLASSCPPGYHPDPTGVCVPDGTTCPPGYHLNPTTGVCVPDTITCPPGYHLDPTMACVPNTTFPWWLVGVIAAGTTVVGYFAFKKKEK